MNQSIINKLNLFFPAYPVEKAWVFGSYARGEETRKSDIDIMVKFDGNAGVSLFDFIRIMNKLQDILHKKVDLVTEGGIREFAKKSIEQDKILIYERDNTMSYSKRSSAAQRTDTDDIQ